MESQEQVRAAPRLWKPIGLCAATSIALLLQMQAAAAPANCDRLLESVPRVLASGYQFTEGPAWNPQGYFVFSDIPANTIYRVSSAGDVAVFKKPSGYANGNAFDDKGNLWSARHDRMVTMTTPGGAEERRLDSYEQRRLNSPNDLIIARDGAVWFSDPNFGITGYGPEKAPEEQPVRGVYRYAGGKLERVISDLTLPNGLALSADERSLYVADYSDGRVYRYRLDKKMQPTARSLLGVVPPADGHAPVADGIKVDGGGNVWVAGTRAIGVFSAKSELLCRLAIDAESVTNLAFGGSDGRDVLITAHDKVLLGRLRMPRRP